MFLKFKKILIGTVFFFQAALAQATCLPVAGLTFEKIDSDKLLVIRGGKNIAIIKVQGYLPKSITQFRFFTEKICDCVCAEEKFHIDGQLFSVYKIEFYSQ
jgi:hypothetical protein